MLGCASSTRSIIDLSGNWDYSVDDGSTWHEVAIPASSSFEGRMVFTKKFEVTPETAAKKNFKVVAYGINYQCEIYINEIFVGKHEGGYTSFSLLIPENAIQIGTENVIRVVVDNRLNARNSLPLRQQIWGWKNYGGIFRDIFIVGMPPVWIDDVTLTTEGLEAKSCRLIVSATVSARDIPVVTTSGVPYIANIEVTEKSTGAVVGRLAGIPVVPQTNKDIQVRAVVPLSSYRLWSPDTPELYSVRTMIVADIPKAPAVLDEHIVSSGIRTISRGTKELFLNGARLTVKGIVWMEDSHDQGASLTYEEMERDVARIKNLGANTIRFGFHPPHPFLLQLCDMYGLLALEEIPLFEVPADILTNELYRALAENYLREMIRRDRNHPSVIAWGFGTGFESVDVRVREVVQSMQAVSKEMDRRLTYYTTRSLDDDKCSMIVDIAGIELPSADLKKFKVSLQQWKEAHPDQAVLVSAYGKPIESGNRNGYSDPMSQESQARFLYQRYDVIKAADIAGGCVSAFSDWRGDRPVMTVKSENPFLYTFGIVELARQKKVAFDVVRSMYLGEKIAALPIGTSAPSSPVSYVLLGLGTLILFAWMWSSNHRFQESVNRAILRPYNFFADIRDQRILSNLHTVVLAVIIAMTFAIVTSSILYHFRHDTAVDYIVTHFLISDIVKAFFIKLVWNPILCIAYVAIAVLVWMAAVVIAIRAGSTMTRTHINFFHAFSVTIWATLPLLAFIPVGMILYRVMESDVYILPVMLVLGAILVWIMLRTMKGISIVYEVRPLQVYAIALLLVAVVVGTTFTYLNHDYSTVAYFRFVLSTVLPTAP
ncbi:MAG: hypothetical protein NTV54_16480 [Ignavibacteriales bacterium]|nr:hypothetical protein [Ignavibacteriales bacterium]